MVMQQITLETHSDEETISAGISFSSRLKPGSVVAFFGELGAGKTRFIKGICKGLGVHEHVASPTFTIVNEYNIGGLKIYHFDFYRMKSVDELREIGFDEYFEGNCIVLIEWADRVVNILPPHRYDIHLQLGKNEYSRRIDIEEIGGVTA